MAHQYSLKSEARAIAGFYMDAEDPEKAAGNWAPWEMSERQAKAAIAKAQTWFPGEDDCEWWGDFLYTIRWNILHQDD